MKLGHFFEKSVFLALLLGIVSACQPYSENVTLIESSTSLPELPNPTMAGPSIYSGKFAISTSGYKLKSSIETFSKGAKVSPRGYKLISTSSFNQDP